MRLHLVLALALLVAAPPATGEAQDRGIQLSRDGARVLVNKDVGTERWAISKNSAGDTLTGNVFTTDADPPSFIFCEPTGAEDTYACQGAGPCATATCTDQYVALGVVTLPEDFFTPPGGEGAAGNTDGHRARAAQTNGGFQETPDGRHVLVSSDVGDERWAITLNRDDRTLTGNVFFPDGGAPAFISCQQSLNQPDTFSCYGAGPCATPGCENQYTAIDTATLPDGFFGPKECGNGRVESNERCEAGTFCRVICGVDELCLQIGGAPIPIPGTCSSDCMRCVRND